LTDILRIQQVLAGVMKTVEISTVKSVTNRNWVVCKVTSNKTENSVLFLKHSQDERFRSRFGVHNFYVTEKLPKGFEK
jgi:hypothetical protein